MDLRDYLRERPGSASKLAADLGISPSYLSQMLAGDRPFPVEMCVQIEELTRGAVRRWDLKPDRWHRIWPELKRAKGAPAVGVHAHVGASSVPAKVAA